MVATAPITVRAPATLAAEYHYELVPLLPLPEVDLSLSVKSRFIQDHRMHQLFRTMARSPLTFVMYLVYMGVGIAVYFLPVQLGRSFAIAGLLLGLPGALVPIGNLRLEVVAVLLKTYDTWFFGVVSTILSVVLGLLMNDARAVLMVVSWLSFTVNICVDASVLGLRQIWIVNSLALVSYATMAVATSLEITDSLRIFHVLRINGHELPAIAVVRDCLITMIILIGRILVRKHKYALKQNKTAPTSTGFQCVSFRCRLQLLAMSRKKPDSDIDQLHSGLSRLHPNEAPSKAKLRLKADVGTIDIRNTLVRMQWPSSTHNAGPKSYWQPLPWIGVFGFVFTNGIYLVNVAWPHNRFQHVCLPIIVASALASTVFVGASIAATQRQLLRAVVTCFEFLFVFIEVTIIHIALADILEWRLIIVLAIVSDLQWCMWMLCWDAITPPVRKRLGLSRHSAAYVGMSLMGVLTAGMVILVILRPPDAIRDRVIYRLALMNHTVELRSLTLYFSCVSTVSTWSLRVLWRLVTVSGSELSVLDGAVVYDINQRTDRRVGNHHQRVIQEPIAPYSDM